MNYLGSKAQYSKYIVPIIQGAIDTGMYNGFIDCCCGGCNIIKDIQCDIKIAIDNNESWIAFLTELQKPEFSFPTTYPDRKQWDLAKEGKLPLWERGMVAIFCSYFTRGFSGGYENTGKDWNSRTQKALKERSSLSNVVFKCEDYHSLLEYENMVIYVDPPYAGSKKYDSSKNFNHEEFWTTMRQVAKKNKVFISEATAPEDWHIIWEKDVKDKVTCGGNKRNSIERLYTI